MASNARKKLLQSTRTKAILGKSKLLRPKFSIYPSLLGASVLPITIEATVDEEIQQAESTATDEGTTASHLIVDVPPHTVVRQMSLSQRLFDMEQDYILAGEIPLSPEETSRCMDLLRKEIHDSLRASEARTRRPRR